MNQILSKADALDAPSSIREELDREFAQEIKTDGIFEINWEMNWEFRKRNWDFYLGQLGKRLGNKWGNPNLKIEIPKKGVVNKIAGTNPINVLTKAVIIRATIISLNFIGAINKFVKFLLHISSKNNILKPILVLNKKSYKIAQVNITPTALL